MNSNRRRERRSGCPISTALDVLGDAWSLLIVRDLMFKGFRTFNEFANAGEGIATNILSDRLARLEAAGILTRGRDPGDARRHLYRLTEKGMDLAPALVEIVLWSARYERTDAPEAVVHEMRTNRERFLARVRESWSAGEPSGALVP
ncbi:MAG TPA: helix-turn-helix domain-containing protein [Longimicrobium sp.]|nr:helix-turn-helix domain-containing protein [Longimicrobium sp.]